MPALQYTPLHPRFLLIYIYFDPRGKRQKKYILYFDPGGKKNGWGKKVNDQFFEKISPSPPWCVFRPPFYVFHPVVGFKPKKSRVKRGPTPGQIWNAKSQALSPRSKRCCAPMGSIVLNPGFDCPRISFMTNWNLNPGQKKSDYIYIF